jgi:hypothetical protein
MDDLLKHIFWNLMVLNGMVIYLWVKSWRNDE